MFWTKVLATHRQHQQALLDSNILQVKLQHNILESEKPSIGKIQNIHCWTLELLKVKFQHTVLEFKYRFKTQQ